MIKATEDKGLWYPKKEHCVALFRLGVRKGLRSGDVSAENRRHLEFPQWQTPRGISCFEKWLTSAEATWDKPSNCRGCPWLSSSASHPSPYLSPTYICSLWCPLVLIAHGDHGHISSSYSGSKSIGFSATCRVRMTVIFANLLVKHFSRL